MGAGAASITWQEMARCRREMEKYYYRRAVRKELRWVKLHEEMMGPDGAVPPMEDRAEFPCFHLCSACGFMDRNVEDHCPACGANAWYDLGDEHLASTLRDEEEKQRHRSPWWVKLAFALWFLAVIAFVAVLSWGNLIAVTIAVIASVVAYALLLRPFTLLILRLSRVRPRRWRMPMPLPGKKAKPKTSLKGKAEITGDLLTAPFSGRKCIAYQVSILFDTPADARPPQWVVMETWGMNFHINGIQVDGDSILVKAPLKPVDPTEDDKTGLNIAKFLRERGLFAYDGDFGLFEAVVEQNDNIEVKFYEETKTTVVTVV